MASSVVRVNPVTVNDRVYLHGYLPQLRVGGQVVQFLRHNGFPVPSPACLQRIGDCPPALPDLLRLV